MFGWFSAINAGQSTSVLGPSLPKVQRPGGPLLRFELWGVGQYAVSARAVSVVELAARFALTVSRKLVHAGHGTWLQLSTRAGRSKTIRVVHCRAQE